MKYAVKANKITVHDEDYDETVILSQFHHSD